MPESLKLVLHVAQVDKWEGAISNAANFLKTAAPGEHLEIRIVANSDAVFSLRSMQPEASGTARNAHKTWCGNIPVRELS